MPEIKIEHKSIVCREVKVSRDEKHLYIEAYGAYFENVDSYGDVIKAGAFAKFLKSEDAQRVKLCWQHNFDDVLGVIIEMGEDERGLWFKAMISNTALGKDAATLIEDGALNEFSIGYSTREAEYPSEDEQRASGVYRYLKEVYLYEISLVTRAANPMATLTGSERKDEKQTNKNNNTMPEEEIKKQLEEMKREQKRLSEENESLRKQIDEAKKDTQSEDVKKSLKENEEAISNLDESIKQMNEKIAGLVEHKEQTPAEVLCNAIRSDEFKNLVKDVVEGKRANGRMEVKLDTSAMTGTVIRSLTDTTIYADAQKKRVFIDSIRKKDVPQDKSVVVWPEGSFTSNANYVGEGSEVGSADGASAEEKTRGLAKVGAKLPFTRETSTDLAYFLNWVRSEAIEVIRNKVDTLILSGDGADTNSTTKKHIYGILGQGSVAFNATTAGLAGEFDNPGLVELNDAVDAQIYNDTNDAFVADTIYMNPSDFAKYKNLKDKNDRLLFEYVNGGIYNFLGKNVVRTGKMTKGSMLFADTSIWDLYEKLGFEIEIERVAKTDSYVMYLRWRGQLVTPSNKKKAAVYVASIATALAAITKGSGSGSGSGSGNGQA
jgi:HK97 family phage prohead protease